MQKIEGLPRGPRHDPRAPMMAVETIGPEGGTIIVEGADMTIQIPPGALRSPATIRMAAHFLVLGANITMDPEQPLQLPMTIEQGLYRQLMPGYTLGRHVICGFDPKLLDITGVGECEAAWLCTLEGGTIRTTAPRHGGILFASNVEGVWAEPS